MTRGTFYTITYEDFYFLLDIPIDDIGFNKIHEEEELSYEDQLVMYDQTTGCEIGKIHGFLPFYSQMNKILRFTICQKGGDANSIAAISNNLIKRMGEDEFIFSVGDFLWEEIMFVSERPSKGLPYAPYIMYITEKVTELEFVKEIKHKSYQPRPTHLYEEARPRGHSTRGRGRGSHARDGSLAPSSSRGPSSSTSTAPSDRVPSPLRAFSKSIFNMVKCTNSRSIRTTNSAKQTKCHLNLEASVDDDEEGIEDPFATYEAAQAAA